MSKIIVDQIAKNGGTTFTLPSTDGGANAPLVTNGTGTLAYSPLKLPAADGTANKPITTDGSGQLQFNPAALPAAIGTAGQTLAVNSGATALEYAAPPSSVAYKKTYDFNTLSATNTYDLTWASINSGITYAKIAGVRLTMYEIASSGDTYIYLYGLNSGGSVISSGYLGCSYYYKESTSGSHGEQHNSNQGWMRFPAYGNDIKQTDYTYGSGVTGQINFIPWREGSAGSNQKDKGGGCWYQIMYQNSSNTWPSQEYGGWNNYSTNNSTTAMEGGFRFYATSGNFNHGKLVVEVQMEEG